MKLDRLFVEEGLPPHAIVGRRDGARRQRSYLGTLPGADVEREDLRRVTAVRRGSDVGVGHQTPARAEGQVALEVRGAASGDPVRRVAARLAKAVEAATAPAHE